MSPRTVAPLLALALLVAACGDDGDAGAPRQDPAADAGSGVGVDGAADDDVLVSAIWATTSAGRARTYFEAEVDGGGGEEVRFGGDGLTDFAAGRGQLALDIRDLLDANGLTTIDGRFDTVFDGNRSFLSADLFDQLFSPPRPWLELDITELSPDERPTALGAGLRGLTQFAGYDPSMGLRLISGVINGTVRDLGVDEVRGDRVRHYTAEVNLRVALAATSAPVRERLVARIGTERLPVDVWIDDDGLLRRLSYEERGSGGDPNPVMIEFFEFGVEEGIDLPPTDEVANLYEAVPIFG
jgi:hypothetical protein